MSDEAAKLEESNPVRYDEVDLLRFLMGMPDAIRAAFTASDGKQRACIDAACVKVDEARLWLEELRALRRAEEEE